MHIIQYVHEYEPFQVNCDSFTYANKAVRVNTLEQFYIQLYNHQNNLIPERHAGDRYPLCDLQMKHATTWRNTFTSVSLVQAAAVPCWLAKQNLTSRYGMYKQPSYYLYVYDN